MDFIQWFEKNHTSANSTLFKNFVKEIIVKVWKKLSSTPQNRALPNISFWSKTKLRTSRTSPKTEQFANIRQFVPRLDYFSNAAEGKKIQKH